MAVTIKKRRLINPHNRPARKAKAWSSQGKRTSSKKRRPRAQRKHRKTTTNPALITLGLVNPQRGPMKKKAKKHHKSARKPNPAFAHFKKAKSKRGHRRRGNPSILTKPVGMAKAAAIAGGSLILTRQLPQLILGAKNTGLLGYATNIATMIAATILAGMAAGKEAGFAAGIGGGLYTLTRFLNEYFSPIGKYLSLSGVGVPWRPASSARCARATTPCRCSTTGRETRSSRRRSSMPWSPP